MPPAKTLVYVATEDWYFWLHRLALGRGALAAGYRVIVATRVQEHGARLEAEGFEVLPLPWRRRGGTIGGEVRTLLALWRLFRRERPAIAHALALKPIIYAGLAARLAGVPRRVATVAGLGYVFTSETLKARLLRWPVTLALRVGMGGRGGAVILENPDDGKVLAARGAIQAKQVALVSSCGVDTDRFVAASEPAGPVIVGMACRLVRGKGVGVAVEAMRRLKAAGAPVRFRLAGTVDPGSPDTHTEAEVRGWVDEGVVEWLGHVDDMVGFWQSIHIALYPSQYGEGVPRTLLEAAACGRPIVTTDMPGCREAVVDGVTGYLVPPGNADAVAGRVRQLAEDRALRQRFGQGARTLAEAEFADRVVVARMVDVYGRAD
ncbi:MAG TPA: glycosyltransferase family 4 protein [Stellaceae bacterium]|nr:glycosyltransferase family 4 protein [Stellaceae bacterium]